MQQAFGQWIATVVLAFALGLAPTQPARAITVIDPSNLAQNLLQATRALQQINNQIRQIEQATAMLRQNPLQLSPELSQSINEARQLFQTAQGIAFEADQLGANLRELYPETWDEFDLESVLAQSERWQRESRASLERAMAAEARAIEAIDRARDRTGLALQSSSSADGQTGAIQATNQLLGIQTSQLAEIQMLLIAQGRALETERMEQLAREERALEIQRRAFPTDAAQSLDPARSAFGS